MRQNVYSSAVFAGGDLFVHSNFTWTGSSPSTILAIRNLETLGYPMVKTAYLSVPLFQSAMDGLTNKWICTGSFAVCVTLIQNRRVTTKVKMDADILAKRSKYTNRYITYVHMCCREMLLSRRRCWGLRFRAISVCSSWSASLRSYHPSSTGTAPWVWSPAID